MAHTFVRRYRGEEPVRFLHPALAPILGTTQGVLLFQEQILRVAREIAGLSWAQADQLRRGMSKFGHEEMAEMEAAFVRWLPAPPPEGPGFNRQQAETLWEQVLAFAGYGFNQGHATAYAMVSYRSAYLKPTGPPRFSAPGWRTGAAFTTRRSTWPRPRAWASTCARRTSTTASGALPWAGRENRAYCGWGWGRCATCAAPRSGPSWRNGREQPFADLRDLLRRVPLQDKEVTHLVQCGALDGLGESRAALLAETGEIRQAGSALQMTLGFAGPEVEAEPAAQRLAWERHLLGQPVSVHPLEVVADRLPPHLPLRRLPEQPGQRVTVAGVRLPGWTGGQGFFLSDGDAFVTARGDAALRAPPPWQPLVARGRWTSDEWGTAWFQVEEMEEV